LIGASTAALVASALFPYNRNASRVVLAPGE
jgi:hypothetical protein